MDFELLNLLINKIHLFIKDNNELFLELKAFHHDPFHSYTIFLSNDKNKILEFLGFDTSIEYDKLSTKNMFEYLCTSNKLDYKLIKFFGFKGPHAPNRLQQNFNDYLINKKFTDLSNTTNIFNTKYIIEYFDKTNEYNDYKEKRNLYNNLIEKKISLGNRHDQFYKFLIVHGIQNIINYNNDELINKWNTFCKENWSGLIVFT
jgi:hypothetical protein